MSLAIRLAAEPLRSLGFASISGTYMGIGTALLNPARLVLVQNLTDETMIFSLDGINDNFVLPFSGYVIFDITTNQTVSQQFYVAQGTRFYVKDNGVSPTLGSVYLSVFYGKD